LETTSIARSVSLTEIEAAVKELSREELAKLAAFIARQDKLVWDEELEQDFSPGGEHAAALEKIDAEDWRGKLQAGAVKSHALASFWRCYDELPGNVQRFARKNFELFKANPRHPSLGFQKKGGVYTVEVGRSYRAIARERDGEYYWFWIGTHEEYNRFRF